jgi:hypothetical protein
MKSIDSTAANRRHWLLTALGAGFGAGIGAFGTPSTAQTTRLAQRPDPKVFETGDLVWPKPSGAFIPYSGTDPTKSAVSALELREEEWQRLRVLFVRSARASAPALPEADRAYQLKLANEIEAMTYSQFVHDYAAGVSPGDFQTYGIGQLAYVGHVALIDVDVASGVPYVIEAVYGPSLACQSCVQRVRYTDWLQARGDVLVWHGRLRNLDGAARQRVVEVARRQLQKPYQFFNFNLADASGFYCSKLVWYAVQAATGIHVDGNSDSRRLIWFSPLQLLNAREQVQLLSSPGNYRNA